MFKMISKENYLYNRQAWRDEYMDLSQDIRALKKAQKEAAKGGWEAASRLQSLRARMSNSATEMMDELEILKENSRLSVLFGYFIETRNSLL